LPIVARILARLRMMRHPPSGLDIGLVEARHRIGLEPGEHLAEARTLAQDRDPARSAWNPSSDIFSKRARSPWRSPAPRRGSGGTRHRRRPTRSGRGRRVRCAGRPSRQAIGARASRTPQNATNSAADRGIVRSS
jgi:hypothetical protein